jgi:hypothetical protein
MARCGKLALRGFAKRFFVNLWMGFLGDGKRFISDHIRIYFYFFKPLFHLKIQIFRDDSNNSTFDSGGN